MALPTVSRCVDWVREHTAELAAVDSPIGPAPDGHGLREEERTLRTQICGIRWTPSQKGLEENRAYYGWILHGFELYAELEMVGIETVECFPTASWTRWLGPRGSQTRAAWTRGGLERLGLAGIPARTNQDVRDALAAAMTARLHTVGRTDGAFGAIVVPLEGSLGEG